MRRFGSHVCRHFGLLALLTCNDVLLCECVDYVFKFLPLVIGNFVAVNAPNRILEHNTGNHARFHFSVFLTVEFRMIKEVVESLRPNFITQISQEPGINVGKQSAQHFSDRCHSLQDGAASGLFDMNPISVSRRRDCYLCDVKRLCDPTVALSYMMRITRNVTITDKRS